MDLDEISMIDNHKNTGVGDIAGKRKHCNICGMGQGKGHDNAEQNKLRRMAWRALSNLPVF